MGSLIENYSSQVMVKAGVVTVFSGTIDEAVAVAEPAARVLAGKVVV